jgi:hypothetical protein
MFGKPKKGKGPRPIRRSSTTRNIGNGQVNDDDEDESFAFRRKNSVGILSDDDLAKKREVDDRVAEYVTNRLQRMRTNDSVATDDVEDEIEAQADGGSELTVQSP